MSGSMRLSPLGLKAYAAQAISIPPMRRVDHLSLYWQVVAYERPALSKAYLFPEGTF